MKPTQEQVIAWAEEAGFTDDDLMLRGRDLQAALTLAYEAGRKDENDGCAEAIKDLWGAHPIDYEDVLYAIRARVKP